MRTKIRVNVEGHRLLDNGVVCEDVTKITLPTIKHPTTEISGAGLALALQIPNQARVEPMEFAISHNNGVNCNLLINPGVHFFEVRTAISDYVTVSGSVGYGSIKYRVYGQYVSSEKGDIETGNPLGSTEKYSVTRFEEIIDGKTTVLIDAGNVVKNGVNCIDPVENLLK